MSDKELILDSIRRMPDDATMAQILDRVRFIAALEEARLSLKNEGGIPVEHVMNEIPSWVQKKSRPTRKS